MEYRPWKVEFGVPQIAQRGSQGEVVDDHAPDEPSGVEAGHESLTMDSRLHVMGIKVDWRRIHRYGAVHDRVGLRYRARPFVPVFSADLKVFVVQARHCLSSQLSDQCYMPPLSEASSSTRLSHSSALSA